MTIQFRTSGRSYMYINLQDFYEVKVGWVWIDSNDRQVVVRNGDHYTLTWEGNTYQGVPTTETAE